MKTKSQPLVTIAIPTYNRADSYLPQTLKSAVKQTYQNIEIIVSDNYSQDNTEIVVSTFKDQRIRYFRHKENIGANNNFNFCLKHAKGAYFLLLQDDDFIDHDFVDVCMKATEHKTESGIIRTGTRLIDAEGNVLSEMPNMVGGLSLEEFFRGWFANKTSPYLCSTLFNTRRLKELGGFGSKHNLFQDVLAEVQLAARWGRVDVEDVKASFRKHEGEMTFAAKVKDWCEDSLFLLNIMCTLVPENSREKIMKEGLIFFSKLNYGRAKSVQKLLNRFLAYIAVLRKFNYRYLPSSDHFISAIYGTPLYYGLRFIKRKIVKSI